MVPPDLADQFSRGNGVIFVGAGMSKGAGLMDWAELVGHLASELPGCPSDADYRDVAQYYEIQYGRHRLVERIRERLDTMNVHPTVAHQQLVRLPVSTIFTTNYDDLLEQALRASRQPYATVVRNVDTGFWSADRLQLVKLHGDLTQAESIVITSEDYERFTIDRPSLARLLVTTIQTHAVLFVGYSVADYDLRLILTQVHAESERYARKWYTVQFDAPDLAVKGLERRGMHVINLDSRNTSPLEALTEWLAELQRQIRRAADSRPASSPATTSAAGPLLADDVATLLQTMGYQITPVDANQRVVDFIAERRFCQEARNSRDAVARWFAVLLLTQVRDLAPQQVNQTLRAALPDETTPETVSLIRQVLSIRESTA